MDVEDLALRRIAAGKPRLEGLDQMLPRHGRALDVPAGAARGRDAGGRGPGRIRRSRGFPEHEVHRVALVGRHVHAGAGEQLVEGALREGAIFRDVRQVLHCRNREEHVLLGHIGRPARDQPLDDHAHLVDMLGRPGLDEARGLARLVHVLRHEHAQRPDVGVELLLCLAGDFADRLVVGQAGVIPGGAGVNLVVYIRDIAHIRYGSVAVDMSQQTEEKVEDDDRAGVADVGVVVNGGSADVEAHVLRVDRVKNLLRPGQRVVEPKLDRHETKSLSGRRPEGGFDLGTRTRRLQPAKCASRK